MRFNIYHLIRHKSWQKIITRKEFEDQQDEALLSFGQTSLNLGIIGQIKEAATLLSENETLQDSTMTHVILSLTTIMEESIKPGFHIIVPVVRILSVV